MAPIVSVAEMRSLEAAAFAAGITEAQLQERAGRAVADDVARMVLPGQRVAIAIGHGNNGRDGAVAGRALAARGIGVDLILAPRHAVTDVELARLCSLGATLTPSDAAQARQTLDGASVVLDAIAGIGTRGALREPLAALARLVAHAPGRIVALDLPSGIDADTGDVAGDVVHAQTTITLGAIKQGLLRFPAAEHVGQLRVRDIGIPSTALAGLPYRSLEPDDVVVPDRPIGAHKYRFGRVLIVAGSDQFVGAASLCAAGALRAGAGLVTVATTAGVRQALATRLPEATFVAHDVSIESDPAEAARQLLATDSSVLVIGPGLGRSDAKTAFMGEVLRRREQRSLVLDADALFALSELDDWTLGPNVVLTPHAGELRRLAPEAHDEPTWAEAGRLARQWNCVLVAKGPSTSVAGPGGQVAVWPHANPALATGGTGDVLAGVCGSLIGQGCAPESAAQLAVVAHALAAERVIQRRGWRTLLASDLIDELPAALQALRGARSSTS